MAAPTAAPTAAGGVRTRTAAPERLETPTARRGAGALERPLTRRELRELRERPRRGGRGRARSRSRGPFGGALGRSLGGSPVARLVVVLLAVTALGAGVLGVVALRAPRPQPVAVPPTPVVEAVGSTTVVGADPLAQGSAGPAALLQGLLDARAAALTARDPSALARVEQPGSAAQGADAALVRRLVASRETYSGLAFSVHDVAVVSRTGDRLVLRARVARAPYELVDATGRRTPQAGDDGTPWRYALVRLAGGWRLAEVRTP